jgi:predicted acetylornithine/succinylornithine family transaminase
MIQDSIIEDSQKYLMHTYARFPIALHKGRGARVWTVDGKRYLDFLAGIAVNCLGHCHPRVVVAIQKQAQRLLHVSNLYHIEPQARLAKLLVENSFANKAFFCNSGAEANEAAIKLARKHSKENFGQERFEIVAAHGSFHGRTMATLSATGQEQYRKGFGPMLQGFRFVPFNDIDALKDAVGPHTCAVILEPVQAEGGVKVPGGDYFRHVRELCNKKNVLLILDEVQTGIGRTGRLFAHEHYGIAPDIMTLAKGLGGGVAIGAMLATDTVAAAFTPGTHASTFGGNPLACAAAIATLETVLEDGLILSNAERMSAYLMDSLKGIADKFPRIVKDVRGLGLLAGIEIEGVEPPRIVRAAMDAGLLIGRAGENVIRFTPPLIVTEEEIDEMAGIMDGVLSALDMA